MLQGLFIRAVSSEIARSFLLQSSLFGPSAEYTLYFNEHHRWVQSDTILNALARELRWYQTTLFELNDQ